MRKLSIMRCGLMRQSGDSTPLGNEDIGDIIVDAPEMGSVDGAARTLDY